LLQDNALPLTATCALETLRKLKWEIMEHPTYSLDLAPSDFHLLGLLKEAQAGRRSQCDKDIKNAMHQWLCAQPQTFYCNGIKKLVGCWGRCAEKHIF
jgi:hypothetical protein